MLNFGIIGAGTVGTALAVLLSGKGYSFAGASRKTAGKTAGPISNFNILENNQAVADAADLVFIATPDSAIGQVAAEVKWRAGQAVVHCSGADSAAVLEPARQAGASVGGFHPLQTFAGVIQAIQNLPGSTFAIEAEEPLRSTLQQLAADMGGHWIELKAEDKVAYHAAAVLACNYLVTLVKMSTDLWNTFGVDQRQAVRALLPLIRGTLNNIETIGIPDCLTGPIARGDAGTVNKHLQALAAKAPSLISTYKELGRQTLPIAQAKGKLDKRQYAELEKILSKD